MGTIMVRSKKIAAVVLALLLCLSSSITAFAYTEENFVGEVGGKSVTFRVSTDDKEVVLLARSGDICGGTLTVTLNCDVISDSGKVKNINMTCSRVSYEGSHYVDAKFDHYYLNQYMQGYKVEKINYVITTKWDLKMMDGTIQTVEFSHIK